MPLVDEHGNPTAAPETPMPEPTDADTPAAEEALVETPQDSKRQLSVSIRPDLWKFPFFKDLEAYPQASDCMVVSLLAPAGLFLALVNIQSWIAFRNHEVDTLRSYLLCVMQDQPSPLNPNILTTKAMVLHDAVTWGPSILNMNQFLSYSPCVEQKMIVEVFNLALQHGRLRETFTHGAPAEKATAVTEPSADTAEAVPAAE